MEHIREEGERLLPPRSRTGGSSSRAGHVVLFHVHIASFRDIEYRRNLNTALALHYLNGNSFVAHQDDKRHVAWVVVLCPVGNAVISALPFPERGGSA